MLKMLEEIEDKSRVGEYLEQVKMKNKILYGFGHRVYKNFDPRAEIISNLAEQLFKLLGQQPLIKVARELAKIALKEAYFIDRKLYPNVDFYSGCVYKALGIPNEFFTVMFTMPRVAGWLAHWKEFLVDSENKIVRPRQNYLGYRMRDYVEKEKRRSCVDEELEGLTEDHEKRYFVAKKLI